MTKIFKLYSIILLFIITPSFAVTSIPPCDSQTGSTACKLVWSSKREGFKSTNVHINDNHANLVSCTPRPESHFPMNILNNISNDNKTLKISYLGKDAAHIKHTCYTLIEDVINSNKGNDAHGYIEATILVSNDSGGGDLNTQAWPAFWLLGLGADWPMQGEIDIAEDINKKTSTNLHGEPKANVMYAYSSERWQMRPGLDDNNHQHTYGIEWQLLDNNILILNLYYDRVYQYTISGDTTVKPYLQIKQGLQGGKMAVVFDTDQTDQSALGSDSDNIRYSMTVSNVNVYSITP